MLTGLEVDFSGFFSQELTAAAVDHSPAHQQHAVPCLDAWHSLTETEEV